MKSVMDKIGTAWLIVTTVIIGVLSWLYHRRGQKLATAVYNVQKGKLETKLAVAKQKAKTTGVKREAAQKNYDNIRRRYSATAARLGIVDHEDDVTPAADGGDEG